MSDRWSFFTFNADFDIVYEWMIAYLREIYLSSKGVNRVWKFDYPRHLLLIFYVFILTYSRVTECMCDKCVKFRFTSSTKKIKIN